MQLCIDAADDHPGVALATDGVVAHSHTWETEQNHSKELLPNIDRLLADATCTKTDVTAVFVDIGPGGYAALRVGVSIAKALAHGLNVPIVGIGRLELDAWRAAEGAEQNARYVAVHRAGRGELACAAYERAGDSWQEHVAPRITKSDELVAAVRSDDIVTGDVDEALADALQHIGAKAVSSPTHRVLALAALGHRRLTTGSPDKAETLVPMYLRAPAIGPQR
jgi:tRNA threonylcarbamoyladenosine biosynthesis protein TsaB